MFDPESPSIIAIWIIVAVVLCVILVAIIVCFAIHYADMDAKPPSPVLTLPSYAESSKDPVVICQA